MREPTKYEPIEWGIGGRKTRQARVRADTCDIPVQMHGWPDGLSAHIAHSMDENPSMYASEREFYVKAIESFMIKLNAEACDYRMKPTVYNRKRLLWIPEDLAKEMYGVAERDAVHINQLLYSAFVHAGYQDPFKT